MGTNGMFAETPECHWQHLHIFACESISSCDLVGGGGCHSEPISKGCPEAEQDPEVLNGWNWTTRTNPATLLILYNLLRDTHLVSFLLQEGFLIVSTENGVRGCRRLRPGGRKGAPANNVSVIGREPE